VDVITEARKSESISVSFWNTVVKQEPPRQQPSVGEPSNNAAGSESESSVQQHQSQLGAQVVLLYAQVLQGELPVLNANVTAVITVPGSPQLTPNTITVRLFDSGSGGTKEIQLCFLLVSELFGWIFHFTHSFHTYIRLFVVPFFKRNPIMELRKIMQ